MTILVAHHIPNWIVEPFVAEKTWHENGMTYGLSECGYDIRVAQRVPLRPGDFALVSSLERFTMPNNLVGVVHDKSTLARCGVAVQNTVLEPGWCGWLTLELTHHGREPVTLEAGSPIAQVLFHQLSAPAAPYRGRYQDQPDEPVAAKWNGA